MKISWGAGDRAGVVMLAMTVMFFSAASFAAVNGYAQEAKDAVSGTTLENLMAAYNGESNANARYLAFADQASKEGYDVAAKLFKTAAAAEEIHFLRHAEVIKQLGGTPKATIETPVVKSTKENLESAVLGETYEKDVMYPAFVKQAQKENIKDAVDAFEDAGAAEAAHARLYEAMFKNLDLSKGLVKDFYVCPVCGNVVDVITTAECPICGTDTRKFKKII